MDLLYITPEYFQALRIPLLRGRSFTTADRAGAARVAIVTRSFVQKYLRDQDPLGRHLAFSDQKWQVVGVVGDVARGSGWGQAGPLATLPAAFIPAAQVPDSTLALIHTWFSPSWIVRTRGPRQGIDRRHRARHPDDRSGVPIARFRDLDEVAAGASPGNGSRPRCSPRSPASPCCWRPWESTASSPARWRSAGGSWGSAWRSAPPSRGPCSPSPSPACCWWRPAWRWAPRSPI